MGLRIVTGRTGTPHVTSYQMQSLYRGLFGDFALLQVGERFEAEKRSKNLVWIKDGVMLFQGVYAIIPYGEVATVNIENVEPGYKRIDVICVQYYKDISDDTEQANIVVVKGTASTNPVAPDVTDGDRWYQDDLIQVPLYDVLVELDDITITPRAIMDNPYPTIAEVFQSVSNGKVAIASAITDKGVLTDATDTFGKMAENIGKISVGGVNFSAININYEVVEYEVIE